MLREAPHAEFVAARRLWWRRYRFVAGRAACEASIGAAEHSRLAVAQAVEPVAVAVHGRRRYWWFHDRFWWEDEGLDRLDVLALVAERERRATRRLARARAALAADAPADTARPALSVEVKQAVWARCNGRCAACGSDRLLEFDHIIPLAMGGSNGERNLQLLCAECNREKGDRLG